MAYTILAKDRTESFFRKADNIEVSKDEPTIVKIWIYKVEKIIPKSPFFDGSCGAYTLTKKNFLLNLSHIPLIARKASPFMESVALNKEGSHREAIPTDSPIGSMTSHWKVDDPQICLSKLSFTSMDLISCNPTNKRTTLNTRVSKLTPSNFTPNSLNSFGEDIHWSTIITPRILIICLSWSKWLLNWKPTFYPTTIVLATSKDVEFESTGWVWEITGCEIWRVLDVWEVTMGRVVGVFKKGCSKIRVELEWEGALFRSNELLGLERYNLIAGEGVPSAMTRWVRSPI